jgi:hypothetical protein
MRGIGARLRLGLLLVALSISMAACTADEPEEHPYTPATLSAADADGVKTVTFTEDAAKRVGLQTEPAVANGTGVIVSYAALIYDKKGESWVYTAPQPLSYKRVKVVIDRIDGSKAMLSAGPAPGVLVVTTGAAEVYGAELDIAGNH